MKGSTVTVGLGVAGVVLGSAGFLAAQRPTPRPLVTTSIQGTLISVDTKLKGIIIRTESGQKMAWRFRSGVIDEAAKFKPKTPLWVIYREISPGNKAVTAIGFPGVESKPVYENGTAERVILRTGPMVEGKCQGVPQGTQATVLTIAAGASADDTAACWCCAPAEEACEPVNRSGAGRIILSACYP
jgi:hypothetical protein